MANLRSWLIVLLVLIGCSPLEAAPYRFVREFNHPAPTSPDWFGRAVALDDEYILIGSPISSVLVDGELVEEQGLAHLYDATTGELIRSFSATPHPFGVSPGGESFGYAVALDEGRALIGSFAYQEPAGFRTGRAFMFEADSGGLLHEFNDPTPTFIDRFGSAVAIDGDHVLIGARGHRDGLEIRQGQAHVFSASTGEMRYTLDNPTPSNFSVRFGQAVHVEDGVAAITNHFASQTHLFEVESGALLRSFQGPLDTAFFGEKVVVDNGLVAISARVGGTFVYDIADGSLVQAFDGAFGSRIAMDNGVIAIGSSENDGEVFLFETASGDLLQTIQRPSTAMEDAFGFAIAMEGRSILIGAFRDNAMGEDVGTAYLYTLVPEPGGAALPLLLLLLALNRPWLDRKCNQ